MRKKLIKNRLDERVLNCEKATTVFASKQAIKIKNDIAPPFKKMGVMEEDVSRG